MEQQGRVATSECVLCDGSGRLVVPDGGDCIAYEPCPICEAEAKEESEMDDKADTTQRSRQNMITLSLPMGEGENFKTEMQKIAKAEGRSVSNLIFIILRDYLKSKGITL